jgi:hypothetical protein
MLEYLTIFIFSPLISLISNKFCVTKASSLMKTTNLSSSILCSISLGLTPCNILFAIRADSTPMSFSLTPIARLAPFFTDPSSEAISGIDRFFASCTRIFIPLTVNSRIN